MPVRRSPPPGRSPAPRIARGVRPAEDSTAADAPHGSRPEQVYLRLRDLIVQGLLAPGSRVVETEVASRLGVSRTPVREALQRLQQRGLLVLGSGRGLVVAHLSQQQVVELYAMREILEGSAARFAARHANELLQVRLQKDLMARGRALLFFDDLLYHGYKVGGLAIKGERLSGLQAGVFH